jgi:hypothetical protein
MEIISVEINQIADNYSYSYHFDKFSSELTRSIQNDGILMPLWLLEGEKYQLLDGHRRLLVANELGFSDVPAIVYPTESLENSFLSILFLNISHSELSVIEKLKVIKIIKELGSNSLYNDALQILQFSYITDVPNISAEVLNFPENFQNYFHLKNVSIKNLQTMLRYPFSAYKQWFTLCIDLAFNFKDFLQYLSRIEEISHRDSQSPSELWDEIQIDTILRSSMTPQQKLQKVKKRIDVHRFPTLNKINNNLEKISKSLSKDLGDKLVVTWDPTLENSGLSLNLNLKETTDLSAIKSFFNNRKKDKLIIELLEKINQIP